MSAIDKLFNTVDSLRENAQANAVFGQPQTVGEKTVIPIAQVSYGFGVGFGEGTTPSEEGKEDTGAGGGAGGGLKTRPVAVLVVTPEKAWVEPIVDEGRVALAGIALAAWGVFHITRALVKIFGKK